MLRTGDTHARAAGEGRTDLQQVRRADRRTKVGQRRESPQGLRRGHRSAGGPDYTRLSERTTKPVYAKSISISVTLPANVRGADFLYICVDNVGNANCGTFDRPQFIPQGAFPAAAVLQRHLRRLGRAER